MSYRSSSLDRWRVHALDREIAKDQQALEQSARHLASQDFACEADAQHAGERWRVEMSRATPWYTPSITVVAHTVRTRPGRPRRNSNPEEVRTTWRVTVALGPVEMSQRQAELARRSTFVLITTVPQARLSAQQLLVEYKGQVHVERHFHFLKDPLFVDALFVKKAERIEALGYVLLIACLLYSLVERRLRQSRVPIPSPSRRVLTRPTGHEVVRHLQSLQVVRLDSGARVIALPQIFHATLEAILAGLQIPATVFTEPPLRDPPAGE